MMLSYRGVDRGMAESEWRLVWGYEVVQSLLAVCGAFCQTQHSTLCTLCAVVAE